MTKKQKNNGYQPLNSLDTAPPNIASSVQPAITEEKEGCVMAEMKKTPEDIKKELAEDVPIHFHVGEPEPRMTPRNVCALRVLHRCALAYIQRLERERDAAVQLLNEIVWDIDGGSFWDVDICSHCKKENCKECRMKNEGFEWRGVQEVSE